MTDLPPRKRRRGETVYQLNEALDSAISSQGSAELAVLHLFNRYNFNFDDLHRLLLGPFF